MWYSSRADVFHLFSAPGHDLEARVSEVTVANFANSSTALVSSSANVAGDEGARVDEDHLSSS